MKTKFLLGLLAAVIPICAAQASPVTFSFTGVVDNDPFGVFDNATFAGSYTFDSNIPQVLTTTNSGGYADSGSSVNMTVSFTGTLDPFIAGPYTADTLNITVNNDFPLDEYLVTGKSSIDSFLSIEIRLDDSTGTAFSNTSLPLAAPNLAAFTFLGFALFDGTLEDPIEAEGVLTSLRCTAGCNSTRTVPEPNAMLMLGVALSALGLARRRVAAP